MTISVGTARVSAARILRVIEEMRDEPSHLVALGVIESLQGVRGNKSFVESLQLIHSEVKKIARSPTPGAG